jgi:hypothetical protein
VESSIVGRRVQTVNKTTTESFLSSLHIQNQKLALSAIFTPSSHFGPTAQLRQAATYRVLVPVK